MLYYVFFFTGVYAVIDLYGLCAQVSITGGSVVRVPDTQVVVTTAADTTTEQSTSSPSVLKTGKKVMPCLLSWKTISVRT
jgi:hypothetical protein